MEILKKKLKEFKKVINRFEKFRNAILETSISEFEFKHNLYEHASAEREIWKAYADIFGGSEFENEAGYEDNYLFPILKKLTESPSNIKGEIVAMLTDFSNSVSGLSHYRDAETPQASDPYLAIVIYRALLENAWKSNDMKAQITLTADLTRCISGTGIDGADSGGLWSEHRAHLDKLLVKIPESVFAGLPANARENYAWCKYQWWYSYHCNAVNCPEESDAAFDEISRFITRAKKADPKGLYWFAVEIPLSYTKLYEVYRYESGESPTPMPIESAKKHFAYLQQILERDFEGIWEAYSPENNKEDDSRRIKYMRDVIPSNGGLSIVWAVIAHKSGIITDTEYWRFLFEATEVFMSLPISDWNYEDLSTHGIRAVSFLCRYYNQMPPIQKRECELTAKHCLQWISHFPVKYRSASSGISDDVRVVWDIATMGMPKHEKVEALIKLTTVSAYAHTHLVAEMAVDIARPLMIKYPEMFEKMFPGMNETQALREVYTAMRLHDLGVYDVSDNVSTAFRSEFDEEYIQVKTRTAHDLKYVSAPEFACARACIEWHHEHFDGRGGFPHTYKAPEAEKYRLLAQLCMFVDCYTSALDRYKNAYQAEKNAADMIEELIALSKPEASAKFDKEEGSVWFNPIFMELITETPGLLKKYSRDRSIKEWIEKAYYQAHLVFQPEMREIEKQAGKPLSEIRYDLADDFFIQRMAVGTKGAARVIIDTSPCLEQAGNPTAEIVASPLAQGRNAIKISGITEGGIQIVKAAILWDWDAESHIIRITGSAPGGTTVIIQAPDSPWDVLATAQADTVGNFTVEATVSHRILQASDEETSQFARSFLIQATGTDNLTIYEIKVESHSKVDESESDKKPVGNVRYELIEDRHLQGLAQGTTGPAVSVFGFLLCPMKPTGNMTATVVENPLAPGKNAIKISGRTEGWESVLLIKRAIPWDENAKSHTILICGTAPVGTRPAIFAPDYPWHEFAVVDTSPDGSFTLEATITKRILRSKEEDTFQYYQGFCMNIEGLLDFTIHNIKIVRD